MDENIKEAEVKTESTNDKPKAEAVVAKEKMKKLPPLKLSHPSARRKGESDKEYRTRKNARKRQRRQG